ncbi:PREDICTED: uncharacterized protein LOC105967009 [Erythranthe guttata]|uniref:uncharacterized protein LOC105967009 n=1 Tax=Erythranthe guttata TaxID=4155 RepID=UPI00064E0297|nr:PREDICTED: uncharacterized protein LOC105967009 [Erythranthe guttata]|eukprot:XP_012847030.1 PREDICTED: uncharacterized protein LOC105967009 [Erythranthe guttata]
MVDEARDISMKKQMALVVRYVNKSGSVIEQFLGVEHVTDTSALTLKATINDFFSRYGLSVSKLRGQGYDGASNMRGDTRWSSHYNTLLSLIHMFDAVIDVVEVIGRDASSTNHRIEAQDIVDRFLSFDFVLRLFLMKNVLTITNELSQTLQRKDQDIVNAMRLNVTIFYKKHKVDVPQMNVKYVARGRRRRNEEEMSNLHHYKFETFYTILDMQLGELNARFSNSTMELLVCIACLDPSNSFSHFDKDKLLRLVEFYLQDFTELDKCKLNDQLDTYIVDMSLSSEFQGLNGISDLARKMVETRRNKVYPLVYLILTLALMLSVATTTIERAFSAMSIIKSRLRSRMRDEWLSDAFKSLIYAI